jgi:hypothetical protein
MKIVKWIKVSVLLLILFLSAQAKAQTADDVIKKYVQFIGGKKNWKKVKTITTSGEYDYGGIVFPFHTFSKRPDKYKFVVPFNGKYYAQAFDGTKGWKIDAFKNETKPTLLSGKAARAMANESDVELESALINYPDKGHQVKLVGKDSVQHRLCFNIELTKKNGEIENYYFDSQSAELVKKSALAKNVELGGTLLTIFYSDYREVEGLMIPFKTVCQSEGQMILTVIISKAALNTPIDDEIFQP